MTRSPEIYAGPPGVAAKPGGRFLPPARYRHPGDIIRLILAGLVLAGAVAVTVITHATYAGASGPAGGWRRERSRQPRPARCRPGWRGRLVSGPSVASPVGPPARGWPGLDAALGVSRLRAWCTPC